MTKLSVVIITYNEERNIARCLESVKDIADEIVVVDSRSTDVTREICLRYGARFFVEDWKSYSEQKNHGNRLAANDWILSIDADEEVSGELRQSIVEWKHLQMPVFAGFNRLTNYCGRWIRHCGWYPDPKIRIFDATRAEWVGDVHECLRFDKSIPARHLRGDLLHYTYYTIEEHIERTNRFSTLGAQELYRNGKRVSFARVLVNPPLKFLRNYIVNRGFLDGYYGYAICRISALQTFLKYFKAWRLQRGPSDDQLP